MALYRLTSFLSIFSLVLAVPIPSNFIFSEAATSPSLASFDYIPALSMTKARQVFPLDSPSMFVSPDKTFRTSEDAGVAPAEAVIHSGEDLSALSSVGVPTEATIETRFRRETTHTSKGFWSDLFRIFMPSPPAPSATTDKRDNMPSLPPLDLGPKFDEKDITDSLFWRLSKKGTAGERSGTDFPVDTTLTHQPGSNTKNKGLGSGIVGYNRHPASTRPNSKSHSKPASVAPRLPRLGLGPAFEAKRDLKGKNIGPAAVIVPPTSTRLRPQPLLELSLASIAKLHRDVRFTNPSNKSSSHSTKAFVSTPFSVSTSAHNRLKEPAAQNKGTKGWRLERIASLVNIPGMVLFYSLLTLAVVMMLCYAGLHSTKGKGARRMEVLPRFNEKEM